MNTLSLLFPKARAEVLRLLFGDKGKELHLRELARLSGLAVRTLQLELEKESKGQLVTARRDGNRLYYRANTEHPLYLELHGIAVKTTGLCGQVERAFDGLAGIEYSFIFGSQAAGTAEASSDVDLIVIGTVGLRALAPRMRRVGEVLGREINPILYTREAFATKVRAGDAFIANILAAPRLWIVGNPDEFGGLAQ